MGLRGYVSLFREQWHIVVAAIIVGLAVAAAITGATPARYSSEASVYVSTQGPAADSSSGYDAVLLAQQKVKSYVDLFSDPRIAQDTAGRLGGSVSPGDITNAITATATPDTTVIRMTVVGSSPALAQRIATAATASFVQLVDDLERPTTPQAQSSVSVRVVQPATFAPTRISPSWTVDLVLGLLGGLAVGLAAVMVRNVLDTTIKSADRLEELTESPSLGTTAYDPSASTRPLVVRDDSRSVGAELYRQLRTSLEFVDVDRPQRLIVGTSPSAGDGKSTALCNLALALEKEGRSVALVNADLRCPRLESYLGLEGSIGLTTVLTGRVALDDAIQLGGEGRLAILASGMAPPNPSELLGSQQMAKLLDAMRDRYELVLIDTPPLVPVTDAAVLATAADGVLLFVRHGATTEKDVSAAVSMLAMASGTILGTVLTAAPVLDRRRYASYVASAIEPSETAPASSGLNLASPRHVSGRTPQANNDETIEVPGWSVRQGTERPSPRRR